MTTLRSPHVNSSPIGVFVAGVHSEMGRAGNGSLGAWAHNATYVIRIGTRTNVDSSLQHNVLLPMLSIDAI